MKAIAIFFIAMLAWWIAIAALMAFLYQSGPSGWSEGARAVSAMFMVIGGLFVGIWATTEIG